jgi:MFS family permease
MDKYGRKVGVMYCATLSIIGGVCLCAAQNIAMFIVFRFFAGAGSWAFLALSKAPFSCIPLFSLLRSPFLQRVGI